MIWKDSIERNYGAIIAGMGFTLSLTAMGFGRYIYPLVLPAMKDGLNLTYSHMGTLTSANLIGHTGFAVLGGILATRFGPHRIIVLAAALSGMAMILLGLAPAYPAAFVAMVLMGVGRIGVVVSIAGLTSLWFPPHRWGSLIGFMTLGANIANIITAFLVPLVMTSFGSEGWRHAWIYFGGATVVSALIGYAVMKPKAHENPLSEHASDRASGKMESSIHWGQVFRNRTLMGLFWIFFLNGFFLIYTVFFVAYLTKGLGLPIEVAGIIWLLIGVPSIPTQVLWGVLSDRIGRKRTLIPCLVVMSFSILLPVLSHSFVILSISAFLFGSTFTAPLTILLTMAGDIGGPTMASAASGMVTMGNGLGQMIGPGISGFLIDLTGSFYPGFLLSATAIFGELLLLMVLRPQTRTVVPR